MIQVWSSIQVLSPPCGTVLTDGIHNDPSLIQHSDGCNLPHLTTAVTSHCWMYIITNFEGFIQVAMDLLMRKWLWPLCGFFARCNNLDVLTGWKAWLICSPGSFISQVLLLLLFVSHCGEITTGMCAVKSNNSEFVPRSGWKMYQEFVLLLMHSFWHYSSLSFRLFLF